MSSFEADMEAQLDALAALESIKQEKDVLIAERTLNLPINIANRRKEIKAMDGSKMKSDLKKSTAFVKKIKTINSEGLQQCIRDAETLNLNLYISEIVSALLEIKFKAPDINGIVKLCSHLHCRYDDFTIPLLNGLKESILKPLTPGSNDELMKQRRLQIRLLIEFFQLGLINDGDFFNQLLRSILGKSKL